VKFRLDNPPPQLARVWRAFSIALAFLTVIPTGAWQGKVSDRELADSRCAYPVVGVLVGVILAVISTELARLSVGAGLSAFLILAAWVCLTGGLHLDGLADSFDGLFLWGDSQRRLTVMRDPRIGTFGVTAIVVVLLGKYAALEHLASADRSMAILCAVASSRTAILVAAGVSRYARSTGTGRIVIDAATPLDSLIAAVLIVVFGACAAGGPGVLGGLAILILAGLAVRLGGARLGGITGDILGALVEIGELAFLLVLGVF
jgi:adenosylcobinamide-GDP ribazoletransferase